MNKQQLDFLNNACKSLEFFAPEPKHSGEHICGDPNSSCDMQCQEVADYGKMINEFKSIIEQESFPKGYYGKLLDDLTAAKFKYKDLCHRWYNIENAPPRKEITESLFSEVMKLGKGRYNPKDVQSIIESELNLD